MLLNLLDQLEELPLIEKEVWDLLQRLPMNEQLTLAIRTLSFGQGESKKSEGINAKHLFPPHSAASLLYNLQIVHKTLKQEVAGALWKRRLTCLAFSIVGDLDHPNFFFRTLGF